MQINIFLFIFIKVTITLDNVIRGENAQKEVDNYNSTNPTSKIPKLVNDSLEYVIIEYTTTLSDGIKYTNQGQSSHVGIQICDLDGSTINYYAQESDFLSTSE